MTVKDSFNNQMVLICEARRVCRREALQKRCVELAKILDLICLNNSAGAFVTYFYVCCKISYIKRDTVITTF